MCGGSLPLEEKGVRIGMRMTEGSMYRELFVEKAKRAFSDA